MYAAKKEEELLTQMQRLASLVVPLLDQRWTRGQEVQADGRGARLRSPVETRALEGHV